MSRDNYQHIFAEAFFIVVSPSISWNGSNRAAFVSPRSSSMSAEGTLFEKAGLRNF